MAADTAEKLADEKIARELEKFMELQFGHGAEISLFPSFVILKQGPHFVLSVEEIDMFSRLLVSRGLVPQKWRLHLFVDIKRREETEEEQKKP